MNGYGVDWVVHGPLCGGKKRGNRHIIAIPVRQEFIALANYVFLVAACDLASRDQI